MLAVNAFLRAKVFKIPVPSDVTFEVTHRCNLHCTYCDRHTPAANELETEEILTIISGFHDLGASGLSLDGGEPLTRADFPVIVEHIRKLNMEFRLNTNGTLIPKRLDWIQGATKLKISLDGTKEQHEAMRGKGSFSGAIDGIRAAKEAGHNVELTCVLHRENLNCVQEVLDLSARLGCRVIFQPARNSLFNGRERDGGKWMAGASDLHQTFARLLRLRRRNPAIKNRNASLRHFLNFPRDTNIPCNAGWLNCTIDPQGNVYHCGEVERDAYSVSARKDGASKAFQALPRFRCAQCWCARTVEDNYLWGLKLHRLI